MKKNSLDKKMTVRQFSNGYWYADELKAFAKEIGIPNSGKLRKDELEPLIKHFLKTGKAVSANRKNITKTGVKDCDLGLTLSLPVHHYTSNRVTKDFIEEEAKKMDPGFQRKSGARYRLNRWRDEQITAGNTITYGDLVKAYVHLNKQTQPFTKIPTGRYINFIAAFQKNEPGASRTDAIKAWKKLKMLDTPKDYSSWVKWNSK